MNKYRFNYAQISAIAFIFIILIGAILLWLPISSRNREFTPFINALFTSSSAACVTGLVVYDTFDHFSLFGQAVILSLIQIGGLGFMIVATLFSLMLKKKIGLRQRGLLQESVSTLNIGGVVKLAKHIIIGTVYVELIGAAILAVKFYPEMGILRAIYNGIFHSVSAFCNAGFDLMGYFRESSSLIRYRSDITVNLVIMSLIIIGGIGFFVWEDILENKFDFSKYKLHTKIVILATSVLLIVSTILFYIIEKDNTMKNMNGTGKILASMFQAVTPRTAGFNTLDISKLRESSILLTIILMFIGGSPGSTAGGIKTTTFITILLSFRASMNHSEDLNIFNRRLEPEIVTRAYSVITTYVFGASMAIMTICSIQNLALTDVTFEVISALSTVGMSTGITQELNNFSRLIIVILMFCGRVGSLSVALAFAEKKVYIPIRKPIEKISIG